jgi:WD40 repeat protein
MLESLEGHHDAVECVAFSGDGKTLVTGGGANDASGQLKLWQVPDSARMLVLNGHTASVSCAAYSPDGKTLATGSHDKSVKLWDTTTGKERANFKDFANPLRCLAFSPDGQTLAATCANENTVKLIGLAGDAVLTPSSLDSADITAIAFSYDGALLAASAGGDEQPNGYVRVWQVATGKEKAVLRNVDSPHPIWCVAFSPDGKTLATTSGSEVKLLNAATLELRATLTHGAEVRQMIFSRDGALLATGLADGAIRLFDPETGRERAGLSGHASMISSLSFAPDAKMLAAAAKSGSARVWQVPALKSAAISKGNE